MENEILTHSRMEPFKVLLKIVHDTLKKKPPKNGNHLPGDVVRMSELKDDSPFEPEDAQRVKITLRYDRPEPPSHLTLEINGEAQKKLSLVVVLQVDRKASPGDPEASEDPKRSRSSEDSTPKEPRERHRSGSSLDHLVSSIRDLRRSASKLSETSRGSGAFRDRLASALEDLEGRLEATRRPDDEKEEVSRLIHQLIMERFRDELREIQRRISGRQPIVKTKCDRESQEGSPKDEEESVEYDEKAFLREALGKEDVDFESEGNLVSCYYSTVTDRSIGSSNVSTLLSRRSVREDTTYSAVAPKSTKRYRSDTLNEYDLYETVGETTMTEEEELIGRIRDEWGVIGQVTNALREYRRRPVGEEVFVEAERLLLVATYRRDRLMERLCRLDDRDGRKAGAVLRSTVRVSELAFFLRERPSKRAGEYFVCVLRGGEEARATRASRADPGGRVRFEEEFTFEGPASELGAIELGVYGLIVPKGKKLKKPRPVFAPAVPSFRLRSRTTLRPGGTRHRLTERDSPFRPEFTVTLEHDVRVDAGDRGFLSVATFRRGRPAWDRRWCALEGATLRYWNRPDEETVAPPVGRVELSGYTVDDGADVYNRPRTITLLGRDGKAGYMLSADTVEEYKRWRRQLSEVVKCFQ